jgi:cation diffusion facilitator family transporter
MDIQSPAPITHSHVFLGAGHAKNERRTWFVIWLCTAMMILEIAGGTWFGSIALVADGMHMSTHASALLLAALAYMFARRHADDPRFSFGTGKLGDLAGFTSAIILAMISLLIGYEALTRLFSPVPIHFAEAIPIAFLGLAVNVASAWLLSGGGHDHGHSHGHSHGHDHHEAHGHHDHEEDIHSIETDSGTLTLAIFEDGVPPKFRLTAQTGPLPTTATIQTTRPDGATETFNLIPKSNYLESQQDIPEPHAFTATITTAGTTQTITFEEHAHTNSKADRDNNMRAALVHVIADAAVSVLVIIGLILAKLVGWLWMDPLAGLIGAAVIANWAIGLIRDTGAILLDMNPDKKMSESLKQTIESEGDTLADLHLWRLGPGHLGAIISVATTHSRTPAFYHTRLAKFRNLSHLTVEVQSLV